MTKGDDTPRCGYCRRPLPAWSGRGRPPAYCRRSHRQRAYEARRRAAALSLPDGQLVVDAADLARLHDGLYALEAAMDDVAGDLAERSSGPAYRRAFEHLAVAAGDLRGVVVEPATT
ncbi:MAG: hypothetical protein ACRDZR_11355 [Acidimicrobiales bacterium]